MYTYIMERTQIYLSAEEAAVLDREARRRGQTRSHLIREAIDKVYLSDPQQDELRAALDASFGQWKERRESGEEYIDRVRSGDRLAELWGERGGPGDAPE